MDIDNLTRHLVNHLKHEGFTIQKYEAYSSNSVYLKLDYGLCNSIRISDHHGKKHLQYRYNILKNVSESYIDLKNEYPRYYYSFNDVGMLIERVISDKEKKLRKFTPQIYRILMTSSREKNKNNAGFWQKAITL